MDRTTHHAVFVRSIAAALLVGVLLAGLWLVPGGASTVAKQTYSSADCSAIQNIKNPSGSDSKSFGAEAKATAQSLSSTANKVKDKKLKKSLQGLASFYRSLGAANNPAAAAITAQKKLKAYGKALKGFVKATVACVSQITSPPITAPSVTTPTTTSSSTTSTSSASTSTSTSTSTSSPTTTTTTH